MLKVVLIALPLALYGVFWALRRRSARPLSRAQLNAHTSVLLLGYLLVTAGLGVFWVANQQLPPFDLHYLFGYATLIAVVVHLSFNLKAALRSFSRRPESPAPRAPGNRAIGVVAALAVASAAAFLLGLRHGAATVRIVDREGGGVPSLEAITSYHEISTHSRLGVLTRSPSTDWHTEGAGLVTSVGRGQVSLPAPLGSEVTVSEGLRPPAAAPRAPLAMGEVGTILAQVSGITERRGGIALRAAASSGALFPVELYVIATRVDGLAPGAYRYDADAHALVPLEVASEPEWGRAVADLAPGARADALLVMTAVFQRTGKKYRDRTYRYIAADAGHAVINAHVAARALGVEARWPRLFDEDHAARALGVDEDREGVVALATLGRAPATPVAATPAELVEVPGAFARAPLGDPEAMPFGITNLAHRATSLRAVHADRPGEGAKASLPLAPPAASSAGLFDAIARRRSVRRFSSDPIAAQDFSGVLWEALGAAPLFSRVVDAYVVVDRVVGVEPGVYRYDAAAHALVPVTVGPAIARAGAAALDQDAIVNAAVAIVFASPVSAIGAPTEGARGYRHALLEAGVRGGALYLAGGARGLGVCSVGAFYDEEARDVVGGGETWALHFAALGVPASG